VEIGASDGKRVEILSGARLGDRLITSSTAEFKDRERVRIAN
jgi:HlyD family secretion protein